MEPSKQTKEKVNKSTFLLRAVFWALVGVFFVLAGEFFVPVVKELFRGSLFLFLLPSIVFFLLGIALLFLAVKRERQRTLKKFLILTGASAAGFLVSIILHNFISGLFIRLFGPDFWDRIGLGDEPLFFIVGVFVCPLGFLVGGIGSILLFFKKRKKK